MKTILFGSAKYDLVDNINVHGNRLQATIYKANNSVEQIAENTTGVSEIKVYGDDQSLLGIYNGYTERVAVSLYQVDGHDVVSVELESADITAHVAELSDAVDTQSMAIDDLAASVTTLNETQETQDAAIDDIAAAISGLEPTN